MFEQTDRGQVGIGTLIVFIAMVLVAAIAAGVLINTAGFLQAQAEATGEESSQQVVDRVQISTVTGVTGADGEGSDEQLVDSEIDRIELTVLRSPGADDIDLTNAIIEVFANGESGTLTWNEDDNFDEDNLQTNGDRIADDTDAIGFFAIANIQDADDGSLSDTSDRAKLIFDLGSIAGDPENDPEDATLDTGETVTISVTTASGGTAFVEKRAPSSLEDDETYRL